MHIYTDIVIFTGLYLQKVLRLAIITLSGRVIIHGEVTNSAGPMLPADAMMLLQPGMQAAGHRRLRPRRLRNKPASAVARIMFDGRR